jgi:hypothetical protein
LIGKVKAGRWDSGNRWKTVWPLFDEIREQHDVLGQKIDFSDVKKTLDRYMLFDIILARYEPLHQQLAKAQSEAKNMIRDEFGSPIKDSEGFSKRWQLLTDIRIGHEDAFKLAEQNKFAAKTIELAENARAKLKEQFGVDIQFDPKIMNELRYLANLENQKDLDITPDLINMANRD